MKKILIILAASLLLVACGGGNSSKSYAYNADQVIAKEELSQLIVEKDYDSAAGKSVDITGVIYRGSDASDETHVYYRVSLDVDMTREVMIKVPKGSPALEEGDFIKTSGFFIDKKDVEPIDDGFIAFSEILVIEVESVEVSDYQTIFAPAIESYDLNLTQKQNGFEVTIEKIEFAEEETRLYVAANNGTDSKISIYSFDFVIVANNKNHEEARSNYLADYPQLDSTMHAGTKSEGIVTYDAIDYKQLDGMKIIVDSPYSDNWDLDFEDFIFDIPASQFK